MILGAVLSMFLLMYVSPPIELPIEYYWLVSYNMISFNNWVIALIWIIQVIFSVIFTWSVLKVAYIYDGKSWGYVHSFRALGTEIMKDIKKLGTQLDIDKTDHDNLENQHNRMITENVQKLKKKG